MNITEQYNLGKHYKIWCRAEIIKNFIKLNWVIYSFGQKNNLVYLRTETLGTSNEILKKIQKSIKMFYSADFFFCASSSNLPFSKSLQHHDSLYLLTQIEYHHSSTHQEKQQPAPGIVIYTDKIVNCVLSFLKWICTSLVPEVFGVYHS